MQGGSDIGQLKGVVQDSFAIGASRIFFRYRYRSKADQNVVGQVLLDQDYGASEWVQGRALYSYLNLIRSSRRQGLVIDAGANIGATCRYFLSSYAGIKVVAIEPERNNCALLRINCEGQPVEVLNAAIGSTAGEIGLVDPGLGDWGYRTGSGGDYTVPVITPAEILRRHPGEEFCPFVFKIDIEGAEADLFSGDLAWIDRFACIVIELHDWMIPGQALARRVLRAISDFDFDFIHRGENLFCFNNRILRSYYSK
jgi:FkbM family methyltransferase